MDNNKKFWDRTARLYAPIQEASNRILYRQIAACCESYVTGPFRVLELACGSGQLTLPLYQKARFWKATDFSAPMIEQTRRRCPEVRASVQDATHLPDPDRSFQVVLIANALHIMPDPEAALAEIHRVLDDDGILLAPTFVYEGNITRLRMKLTNLVGFRTYHHWTTADLTAALKKAGFQIIEVHLLPGDPLPVAFVSARKLETE